MNRFGTMLQDVHLLGTSLSLKKGQKVHLTFASNQPNGGWFARPIDCKWPSGVIGSEQDSILLEDGDFTFNEEYECSTNSAARRKIVDTYKIVRHYFRGGRRVIQRGLSLDEAQNRCRDAESSSDTCRKYHNKERTRLMGKWFDGYYKE